MTPPTYRGRFAPSPTGPLHFGSLIAAMGSYLDARAHGGQWLVRIDDLDTPRTVTGAADGILLDLERLGMHWDEDVVYQSERQELYEAALTQLRGLGLTYPCACTRRELGRGPYPGTCSVGLAPGRIGRSTRLRVTEEHDEFDDTIQGQTGGALHETTGDFVVRRGDGLHAYHLAVVVDDANQNITHVVRGADLLALTLPQRHLYRCLNRQPPQYTHLPVAAHPDGQKLSKQSHAPSISHARPEALIVAGLDFLGQRPPQDLADATLADIWQWSVSRWNVQAVPQSAALQAPDMDLA